MNILEKYRKGLYAPGKGGRFSWNINEIATTIQHQNSHPALPVYFPKDLITEL